LGNKIIEPESSADGEGEVQCRERLGDFFATTTAMLHENWTIRVSGHYGAARTIGQD
jgi:hypothetical protein